MGVPWIALDHCVEVFNSLSMMVNHLMGFCPFVDIPDVVGNAADALGEGEYCLFEFFQPAVAEPQMVEDIRFVALVRLIV